MLKEAVRYAGLTFSSPQGVHVQEREDGDPVTVLAISGFAAAGRHLVDVQQEANKRLPEGSEVVLFEFSTGVNVGLVNLPTFGLPLQDYTALRNREVRRAGSTVRQLADEHQRPVRIVGWSTGGLVGLGAWLDNPEEVEQLVAAGAPFGMPVVGSSQRPSEGRLDVIYGRHDLLVPPMWAYHGEQDSVEGVDCGHFGLVTKPKAVQSIVDKVIYFPNETALAKAHL